MTVRPPTLRDKRRYVLVRILPGGCQPDPKDLYYAVAEAATSLWGDVSASLIQPAIIRVGNGYAIVRCRRGMERELALALITVTVCNGRPIALRTTATSGTVNSLEDRLAIRPEEAGSENTGHGDAGECSFSKRTCQIAFCEGQKVDVIEKGFKNAARFYLTTEELEDNRNAATIPDGI